MLRRRKGQLCVSINLLCENTNLILCPLIWMVINSRMTQDTTFFHKSLKKINGCRKYFQLLRKLTPQQTQAFAKCNTGLSAPSVSMEVFPVVFGFLLTQTSSFCTSQILVKSIILGRINFRVGLILIL